MSDVNAAVATTAIEWVNKVGLVGVLVAILIAGNMGVWCWGTQLADANKRAEKWEILAMKAYHVAENPAIPGVMGASPFDVIRPDGFGELKSEFDAMLAD